MTVYFCQAFSRQPCGNQRTVTRLPICCRSCDLIQICWHGKCCNDPEICNMSSTDDKIKPIRKGRDVK